MPDHLASRALKKTSTQLREQKEYNRKNRKITLDFAGRRVIEHEAEPVDLYDAKMAREALEAASERAPLHGGSRFTRSSHVGGAAHTSCALTAGVAPLLCATEKALEVQRVPTPPEGVDGPVFATGRECRALIGARL